MNKLTKLEQETLMAIQKEIQFHQHSQLTISELAEKVYVSPALISKLAKKLGYEGYADMIFQLQKEQMEFEHQESLFRKEAEVMANLLYHHKDSKILIVSAPIYESLRNYLVRRMSMFDLFVVSTYDYQMVDSPRHLNILTVGLDDGHYDPLSDLMRYTYEKGFQTILLTNQRPTEAYHSVDVDFNVSYSGVLEADIISFMEVTLSIYSKFIKGDLNE